MSDLNEIILNGTTYGIGGSSGSFYTETDQQVDLLSMSTGTMSQNNPEGFQNNTTDYRIIDYFAFSGDYISLIYNNTANRYGFIVAYYDSSKVFKSSLIYSGATELLTGDPNNALVFAVPSGTSYVRIQYRVSGMTYLKYVPYYLHSFNDVTALSFVSGYDFKIRNLLSIPNLDNNFKGKKVLCIGDSITENNAHNNNKGWCEYLADAFGMEVYNNGKSGTGLVKGYGSNRGFCNRVDAASFYSGVTFDLILINGNGNDATGGSYYDYSGNSATVTNEQGKAALPIGTSADSSSTLSVYGAMKHLFDALTTKYPLAKIGFITSTPRKQDLTSYWGASKANFYGHGAFDDYVTAIKWVCDEYNVPCLDLYHSTVFHPWNTTNCNTYYADGEIHPNTLGTIEGIVKPVVKWVWDNF